MIGKIHSFQSLGTVDGPGVRAVVFMQGCPLRCACCHNPDTWDFGGGKETELDALMEKIRRLRAYFGHEGGVTVSGGEPLMQADFVRELFLRCYAEGINTALDTSGCIYNEKIEALLEVTDLVLLDYKYTNAEDYKKYVGCDQVAVDVFLNRLQESGKQVWLRHVVIPTLNCNVESLAKIYELEKKYDCIKKVEMLPFRKLCIEKYKTMGIDFPLADIPEGDPAIISSLADKAKSIVG